ncbi:MAG: lysylphosphatidylglycerol synthase domain-containing protein [Elsteraceae bacterium]
MKLGITLGTLFGLALAIALIALNDAGEIMRVVGELGWALIPITAVRAMIIVTCALAWAALLPDLRHLAWRVWTTLRFVREGINVLLPVATVGGEIAGARLLTFWGVAAGVAGAGILVDLLIQAVCQALFALTGALLLLRVSGAELVADYVLAGLGLSALGLGGFFIVLRFGAVGKLETWIATLIGRWSRSDSAKAFKVNPLNLAAALTAIWSRPSRVALSFGLHLIAWFMGAAEIWIALAWLDQNPSLDQVIILESLAQAARGAAFLVPGGLGVQEGGFVVLGQLLNVDPQTSIALSLVKRAPDVLLGLPALLAWHLIEARQQRRRAAQALSGGNE